MILKVMDEINNHFTKSVEYQNFEITTNSVKGSFSETYLVGMYLLIQGSYLNDGLYEITGVSAGEITVDATLTPENTDDSFRVYACSPPQDFIDLVNDISAHNESGLGANSESIDDYSVSYKDDGSWQSVYKAKLNNYRRVYTDLRVDKAYRWQDRLR